MTKFNDLKEQLFQYCQDEVNERVTRIRTAIKTAQDAANEESKSSMGDKYETTRAMMHLEKEKLSGQLQEATKLQKVLAQISQQATDDIQLGSLVETQMGFYYLAVSLGRVQLAGKSYFVISPASPIGKQLLGNTVGNEIAFNGRKLLIKGIY